MEVDGLRLALLPTLGLADAEGDSEGLTEALGERLAEGEREVSTSALCPARALDHAAHSIKTRKHTRKSIFFIILN